MNVVVEIGILTKAPELKKTQTNISVCSFTLAVKRPMTKDKTDFINFRAWRQSAEYLCQYAGKGDTVSVKGRLEQETYTDKSGNNRSTYVVIADEVSVVRSKARDNNTLNGDKGSERNSEEEMPNSFSEADFGDFGSIDDDDLPF